jgi:hypothetical protein
MLGAWFTPKPRAGLPRKDQMIDIILLLMVIASAISLLVVSPRDLQKKTIQALREYEDKDLSRGHGICEDGQAHGKPDESSAVQGPSMAWQIVTKR